MRCQEGKDGDNTRGVLKTSQVFRVSGKKPRMDTKKILKTSKRFGYRVRQDETKNKDKSLSSSAELDLIVRDSLDLSSRGRLGVEAVVEPVCSKLLGQFDTDHTLTHA